MDAVAVSAPGKLMLFGEHAVVYGSPCIVTAVNQRMRVRVGFDGEGAIVVRAPQMGLDHYHKKLVDLGKQEVPDPVRFIEVLVKNFHEQYGLRRGLDIMTRCDFSANYGFGSSAAVTVALAGALCRLHGVRLTKKELFSFCYRTVLDVQGVGSGFDVASAIYGGTLYFVGGGEVVRRLFGPALPLVVGYTGVKADTPTLIRQVAELRRRHPRRVEDIFSEISEVVDKARTAMQNGKFVVLGKLMDRNQRLLEQLGVSSRELDRLILAARRAGALGAKLSGAGGGDCMIAIAHQKQRRSVVEAIRKAGGKVLSVAVGAKGVADGVL